MPKHIEHTLGGWSVGQLLDIWRRGEKWPSGKVIVEPPRVAKARPSVGYEVKEFDRVPEAFFAWRVRDIIRSPRMTWITAESD